MDDLSALEAAEQAAAAALGQAEAEWQDVRNAQREKLRVVADAYREADAALRAHHAANADPNRPESQSVSQ